MKNDSSHEYRQHVSGGRPISIAEIMNIFLCRISILKDCGHGPPLLFRNNGLMRPADVKKREHGSAILVVLVLMGIMTTLVICNGVTLRQLRQELNLIERRQLMKFE